MKKKIGTAFIGAATVAGLIVMSGQADAHHPEVSASSICVDSDASLVTIDVKAWDTYDDGHSVEDERKVNNRVVVTLRNKDSQITVGEGKFSHDNGYRFALQTIQPNAAGSVTVRVTSVVGWGTDESFTGAGEFREATVDLSDDCPVVIPHPTVPDLPVVTTPSTDGSAGTTIVRDFATPTTVAPVLSQPRFAG